MRVTALLTVAALVLIPLVWMLPLATGRDSIALFSQYLGIVALITMTVTQVIATRAPGVETVFGPLDQGYRLHKYLAITAVVCILLHDTIDAEMNGLGRETMLSEFGETLGEISLYGILILGVITVATFIPYHLWYWTHRFMGAFFAASALHYILIRKPFSNLDPLGLYVGGLCALGVLAYCYTLLPLSARRSHGYRVTSVQQTGGATAVNLTPKGRGLRHRAGQFAFFRFELPGLSEPHPFTISSAPREDGSLRITFRPLGDYTRRLAQRVEPGAEVSVQGGFGRFAIPRGDGPQLWIGAGIGVTPFVAWAEALPKDGPEVHLIHCTRTAKDAAHQDLLTELAAGNPRLTLHRHISSAEGRLTADAAMSLTGLSGEKLRVAFCGPLEMRRALGRGFAQHGVSARHFHFEEFEIRTGIGLESFARWLWERQIRTRIGA